MNQQWIRRAIVAAAVGACAIVAACGSSGPVGGPVTGQQDLHCRADGGVQAQPVSMSSCSATVDAGTHTHDADAGTHDHDAGVETEPEYGDTQFNAEGDDDDCKFHVAFTSTPVRQGDDVTFTVTATELATNNAATDAELDAEVFLNETHPAPNSGAKTTDKGNGQYTVGPIRFDASGRWTVRFHLYEQCTDALEDSPHGHVAFFVDVP